MDRCDIHKVMDSFLLCAIQFWVFWKYESFIFCMDQSFMVTEMRPADPYLMSAAVFRCAGVIMSFQMEYLFCADENK